MLTKVTYLPFLPIANSAINSSLTCVTLIGDYMSSQQPLNVEKVLAYLNKNREKLTVLSSSLNTLKEAVDTALESTESFITVLNPVIKAAGKSPAPSKPVPGKKAPPVVEEDDEDVEMDDDEPTPPKKSAKALPAKVPSKKRPPVVEEDDEDVDVDDDEPTPPKKSSKALPVKASSKKCVPVVEEDDEDVPVGDEDDDDADLDDDLEDIADDDIADDDIDDEFGDDFGGEFDEEIDDDQYDDVPVAPAKKSKTQAAAPAKASTKAKPVIKSTRGR